MAAQEPIRISRAAAADQPAVLALLKQHCLPIDGLLDHWSTALVARVGRDLVGSAALELYGPDALLRSVAVDGRWQGRGVGHQLTAAALALAAEQGVSSVYLLTETAAHFFPRFGFRSLPRTAVPAAVQQSVEFTTACPAGAEAMVLNLGET